MARSRSAYPYYLRSFRMMALGFERPLSALRVVLGLAGRERHEIGLRGCAARFRVRAAMDVWSLKETFLDRCYERFGFAIRPGWIIVDIGGGIGDFSVFAALAAPATRVHVFEPFPESFALLQENLARHNPTAVLAYPVAVSRASGWAMLDLGTGEPLHVRSGAEGRSNAPNRIEVEALSLGDALEMIGASRIDLLKLDCEGAEYDILMGADATVLARIERIVLEYHDGFTAYSHADLADVLRKTGYTVETFPNPVHPFLGYMRASRV